MERTLKTLTQLEHGVFGNRVKNARIRDFLVSFDHLERVIYVISILPFVFLVFIIIKRRSFEIWVFCVHKRSLCLNVNQKQVCDLFGILVNFSGRSPPATRGGSPLTLR